MDPTPKQLALWTMIVSVVVSTLLGVVVLLGDVRGDVALKVLGTSTTVALASICALSCAAYAERNRGSPLGPLGAASAALAGLLLLGLIWAGRASDGFVQVVADAWIVAVAAAHLCLLSLPRLDEGYALAQVGAWPSIGTLAAMLIWQVHARSRDQLDWKLIGVVSLVVAALSVLIPIFAVLSKGARPAREPPPAVEPDPATLPNQGPHIVCPKCGKPVPGPLGKLACATCGCRFYLDLIVDDPPA